MKVAILGTASHVCKAPFGDASWEMWAANVGKVPRWDRWFDLHDDASIDAYPGHREFLEGQTKPVYRRGNYPIEEMVKKYGTWFFTSTISYMLAMAIEDGAQEIGLFGVDLAHGTEYQHQKPGCRFFIQTALLRGIRVVMPPEAEVAVPGRLYCFDGPSMLKIKAVARVAELQARAEENRREREAMAQKKFLLHGALNLQAPRELMESQFRDVLAREQALERDALVLDGALQNAIHIDINWTGE